MKQVLTSIGSIFLVVALTTQMSYAQTNSRILKTRGPMFITSAAFFQSLTRIPYNVAPGEEHIVYNGKKVDFSIVAVSQFFGFQFNPYLALGVGVNYEYWTTKTAFVPLYVDFRGNMTDGKIAPHWYLNAGYATHWAIDSRPDPKKISTGTGKLFGIHGYTGGWMGEVGIGVKANINRTSALLITASGKVQESALRYYSGTDLPQGVKPLIVNTNSNGMYISVGLKASVVF